MGSASQVVAVFVFTALIALPISGPMDQIPDLLRSAYDESWRSSAVWLPLAMLLTMSTLVWSTGMLILRQVPDTDPVAVVGVPTNWV